MEKNKFKDWSLLKQNIEKNKNLRTFNEGQVWFISMGKNIGFEQDGKGNDFSRPVLIIKKFNKNIFYGIPLTSIKKNNQFYFEFKSDKQRNSFAILSQMKLYDSKRLLSKIGFIKYKDMKILKEKLKSLIF